MKTMSVTDFKGRALEVVREVAATREAVVLTKRGKPVAEVVPWTTAAGAPTPGTLSHTVVRERDIVSPLGPEAWEAAR